MGTLSLPRTVSVLGSTGSVGVSTLDLLGTLGGPVRVRALTGGRNVSLLAEQALKWRPEVAVIADPEGVEELARRLRGTGIAVEAGEGAVRTAAALQADWVMSAIVGFAGLAPTLAAVESGAVVALANKESLVCAGPALLRRARLSGGAVIPVDSEHSAIFQTLDPTQASQVSRLVLTASGGPFRTWSSERMSAATPEEALAHPNWDMGPKISIDSATMMNKGLEMIEAAYLFGMEPDRIDVVIHPESILHSLVEYADGSSLAQLGAPDMRTPIAVALAWPDRVAWPAPRLDLGSLGRLTFEPPDENRFPALGLARQALRAGGPAPGLLNAANEVAVAAFLDRRIGYLDIAAIVSETLDKAGSENLGDDMADLMADDLLEQARCVDQAGRRLAQAAVSALRPSGGAA
jgi:1-deoxy-D-xylulose-5-phosphate reductoisomerase